MVRKAQWLPVEIWREYRPYAVKLGVDLLIFLTFWVILWTGHLAADKIEIEGSTATFLVGAHEAVVVGNYVLLSLLAGYDIVLLKARQRKAENATSIKRA
jgi:hypothetical protein